MTASERARLDSAPTDVNSPDLAKYFTLSQNDLDRIPTTSQPYNRVGFALQLCLLRYVGFFPINLDTTSENVIQYLSNQLGIEEPKVYQYGVRDTTKTAHQRCIISHTGFHKLDKDEQKHLANWLCERAMDHDKPTLLYQLACERLLENKILRPGITVIERMVSHSRQKAASKCFEAIKPIIEQHKSFLDSFLTSNNESWSTRLHWLKSCASSNSAVAIRESMRKLAFLQKHNVHKWDTSGISPNRQRFLHELAKKSTNQALLRSSAERKYPILIAFGCRTVERVTDEILDMFDRYLMSRYGRAKRTLDEYRRQVAKSTNEKLELFQKISEVILNHNIKDHVVRKQVFEFIPEDELRDSLLKTRAIARPIDDNFLDFFTNYHASARFFVNELLSLVKFKSNLKNHSLMKAIRLIKKLLNDEGMDVPPEVPIDFVPKKWLPYIINTDHSVNRKYYEMCTLWQMRCALRSGDIFVDFSRRYADPETYLMPKPKWRESRSSLLEQMRFSTTFVKRFRERQSELESLLSRFDHKICDGKHAKEVRLEKGKLVVPRFQAFDLPDSVNQLRKQITSYLPRIELTDLLIEVDRWTNFLSHFQHAGGTEYQSGSMNKYLYANILAQACNIGSAKMAQAAKLPREKLMWTNNWFFREETIKPAIDALVDYQFAEPLASIFGGGMLSSSDGQRFPVPIKVRNATALPKYFGYGAGVTFYSWTSDQFSQYGSKVTPATVRDAPYVLDAICDNETELQILEHTTDTSGYTDIVFGLFDLLGLKFSPRIRDIGDQRLYRVDKTKEYNSITPLLKGTINKGLVLKNAENLLRIAGSLKSGWVTASLLISKYQSYPRENIAVRALKEWGRVNKTISILDYILDEQQQRRVTGQLNKGEAIHDLRQFLRFGNEGAVRLKELEDQSNQAGCLTLVTNAIIVWNTVYMWETIRHLRAEGHTIPDEDIKHLSPCRFEHINKYGNYLFQETLELSRNRLRPLNRNRAG